MIWLIAITLWVIQTLLMFLLSMYVISCTYSYEEYRFLKILFRFGEYNDTIVLDDEIRIASIISIFPIINLLALIVYCCYSSFSFKPNSTNSNLLLKLFQGIFKRAFLIHVVTEKL